MVLASYVGFDALKAKLARKGVRSPGALAASIGIKKYGKAEFEQMAQAGRSHKHSRMRRMAKQQSLRSM